MKQIIDKLIKLNKKALKYDDVPVSCIIIKNKKIISKSYNKKNKLNDPFAHAEIIAIKKACKKLKTYNLNDCELYVTLKPCKMCESLIEETRIKKIYYILDRLKEVNITTEYIKIKTEEENKFKKEISEFFKNKR